MLYMEALHAVPAWITYAVCSLDVFSTLGVSDSRKKTWLIGVVLHFYHYHKVKKPLILPKHCVQYTIYSFVENLQTAM